MLQRDAENTLNTPTEAYLLNIPVQIDLLNHYESLTMSPGAYNLLEWRLNKIKKV